MKKLIILFTFTISTYAAAEVINCPTIEDYTFHGISWKLLASQNKSQDISPNNYDQDFYNYDPRRNILEGNKATLYGQKMEYNIYSSRATKDENGITLQCTGVFSSNECPSSWWSSCMHIVRYLRASLPLGHEYKFCMSITGNSFDCETT